RALFFVHLEEANIPLNVGRVVYFVTGLGHEAVMVFFALSGLLISNNVVSRMQTGQWSWGEYATRRVARIYTVLVPALVLTLVVDTLGMKLFGTATYNTHPSNLTILNANVSERLNLVTFLGNAANLQGFACEPLGSNGPLWSLSYEFWYYFIFAT